MQTEYESGYYTFRSKYQDKSTGEYCVEYDFMRCESKEDLLICKNNLLTWYKKKSNGNTVIITFSYDRAYITGEEDGYIL